MVFSVPSVVSGEPVIQGGVIVDVERATELLLPMFYAARRFGIGRPRVVACAPTDASPEERARVEDVVRRAGASAVVVVSEPLAAAVGADIEVGGFYARMIVDIGHGVTDCAVVRSGQVVASMATRVACSDLESDVAQFVMDRHGMTLTPETKRRLLREISFDRAQPRRGTTRVTGIIAMRQGSAEASVPLEELSAALRPTHEKIVGVVAQFLRALTGKTGVEVIESGIDLTGGGALLEGMAESIGDATRLDVRRVPDTLGSVVRGARRMIDNVDKQKLWA